MTAEELCRRWDIYDVPAEELIEISTHSVRRVAAARTQEREDVLAVECDASRPVEGAVEFIGGLRGPGWRVYLLLAACTLMAGCTLPTPDVDGSAAELLRSQERPYYHVYTIDAALSAADADAVRQAMALWNDALDAPVLAEGYGDLQVVWHSDISETTAGLSGTDQIVVLMTDLIHSAECDVRAVAAHEFGHSIGLPHLASGLMAAGGDGRCDWDCIDQVAVDAACAIVECGAAAEGTCNDDDRV